MIQTREQVAGARIKDEKTYQKLGDVGSAPPPDPELVATYDGSMGEPQAVGHGHSDRPGRQAEGQARLS